MDEVANISWEGSARGKSQLFDLPPRHDGDPVAFAWKDAVRVGFRDNPMAVSASDHGRTAVTRSAGERLALDTYPSVCAGQRLTGPTCQAGVPVNADHLAATPAGSNPPEAKLLPKLCARPQVHD